ncbi:MAG: hypothetical protein OXH46_01630 [Gemmatimonadetes bacterium]|nr:hypothetical protein [Gemmatimonadota bacterium]
MKRMRTAFLSLGLALLAGVLFSDPAAAQCQGCGVQIEIDEDDNIVTWNYCIHGLQAGHDSCTTPKRNTCMLYGGSCSAELAVLLDGRAAPRPSLEYSAREVLEDVRVLAAFSASYASLGAPSGFRDSAETRRACDDGIISRSYTPSETSAIRSATAQLKL